MKSIDDFWAKLVRMEGKLSEEEVEQCRARALDNTPVNQADGFRDSRTYERKYFRELDIAYKEKEGEE